MARSKPLDIEARLHCLKLRYFWIKLYVVNTGVGRYIGRLSCLPPAFSRVRLKRVAAASIDQIHRQSAVGRLLDFDLRRVAVMRENWPSIPWLQPRSLFGFGPEGIQNAVVDLAIRW